MADIVAAAADKRTPREVMRQWETLSKVRRELVRGGLLNADATPTMVIEQLRAMLPPDIFGEQAKKAAAAPAA